jgi:sec-independent protein translocase protein TatA
MNFSGWEILVVLFVVLLLFGSSRLPQLARGMGKSISEFKKGVSEAGKEDERELAEKRREQSWPPPTGTLSRADEGDIKKAKVKSPGGAWEISRG